MLSSNNWKEQIRKQEPKKQRFTIKKLTVGVASVLIGFTFMGLNVSASADANTTPAPAQAETANNNATTNNDNANSGPAVPTDKAAQKPEAASASQQSSSVSATSDQPGTDTKQQDSSTQSLNTQGARPVTKAEVNANKVENQNSQDVSNWNEFINALSSANVNTINMTGDITVTGKTDNGQLGGQSLGYNGCLNFNAQNVARQLTIKGNNHTIDFGRYSLMLQDANQKNGSNWDITFEDVKMKGVAKDSQGQTSTTNPGTYGLISLANVSAKNQKNDTVTLKNVAADVTGRPVISGANGYNKNNEYYTLNLSGDNTLTNEGYDGGATPADDGSAIEAGYVNVTDGTTTINMTKTSAYNLQYGGNAIRTIQPDANGKYTMNVAQGATLNITGAKNVKGIYAVDGTRGTVNVDGTINMNMGTGHSIAIFAGNLNVNQGASVDVTTAQDQNGDSLLGITNFDGGQYGVLSIGVGQPGNLSNQDSNVINDSGSIKVVRTSTAKTNSKIISMGSGSQGLIKGDFRINVNDGATLDLQDSVKQSATGMIYVSGTNVNSYLNFTHPKYVNLQRLNGNTVGKLIYLEGHNQTTINNSPIAQWDEANLTTSPSYTWVVSDVQSYNNRSANAGTGFSPAGKQGSQTGKGVAKFLHSNGTVTMAPSQAGLNSFSYNGAQKANDSQGVIVPGTGNDGADYYQPYLVQFLNDFSYWTPQRLAMGTKLLNDPSVKVKDADKYAPETQTINGNTDQTLKDLDAVTGIKDYIENDGKTSTTVANSTVGATVSWYDADNDASDWQSVMGDYPAPTNPTGNLKTTDTSAWAKITYKDGSIDFANIPLHITESTLADQYAPDGGEISVDEGHTLDGTDASNAITNKDQLVNGDGQSVVADNGYSWNVAPNTDTPGNKAGVVTVTYTDGSKDNVPVVVHVKSMAEMNDPQGQDINVNKGETPNPQDGISNKDQMPDGTKYTWPDGKTPDTSKPGKVPADVVVTYPDGSQDVVPTTIVVKDPSATPSTDKTDADANDPQGKTVNTTIGNVPSASDAITWPDGQPTVQPSRVDWSQTPNVYSKGEHPGTVKVTYPDGSVDYVPTTVNVTNEPTGKTVTTPKGTVPDADTTIDWGNGTEPTGTTVEWQTKPDVNTPGAHPGTVQITYPDGENTTVPVNVVVTDSSTTASDFNPYGTTINVPYGHEMTDADAQKAIAGGVPANAKDVSYTWATNVDTKKPGLTQAYVKVTATIDGKTQTKNVPVYVNVGDMAASYDPQGQNLTVNKGAEQPTAESAISNTGDLPQGTKYTWAIAPDTNTVGTQSDLVKVTYPDNSVDYVPVNVTVKANLTDSDQYQPEYKPVSVMRGESATDKPSWKDDKTPADGDATFTSTTDTPAWATIAKDGTITLNPTADMTPGAYTVPVTVTYKDGSSEIVYAPVAVNGENTTTYYGNQATTSITVGEYTSHKTTDGSATVAAPQVTEIEFKNQDQHWKVLSSVTYQLKGDKYVATTPIVDANGKAIQINGSAAPQSFSAKDVQTSWKEGFAPNTDASNYESTGSKQYPGSGTGTSLASTNYKEAPYGDQRTQDGQSLPGNSKTRVNITMSGADNPFRVGSWSNAFGNIYGATTGETLTFKQNQDISNLTQDQYRQLINVTDLGKAGWNGQNINPNAPQVLAYVEGTDVAKTFTMTWAPNGQPSTANVADGVKGTVRIFFNDGTYLDVPATINVVKDSNAGKPDDQKTEFSQKIVYTYNGKEVATTSIDNIKKGSDVSADTLKSAIDSNVPSNYTIETGYKYPAGLTNVTATPDVINVPLTLKSGETFALTGKLVYKTADGKTVANGPEIKTNAGDTLTAALLHDLADKSLPAGYEIVTYPASFNVTKNTENGFTIPVVVKKDSGNTPTPTTNDAEKYTPSYKDTTVNAKDPVNTGAPTFTESGKQGNVNAPAGTKFSFDNGQTTKTITDKNGKNSVEAKIDANTGAITFTAPDAATEYDISVTVTYPDQSTDSVTAKVFVKKNGGNTPITPTTESFTQDIVYKDAQGKTIHTASKVITGTFTSTTPATVSAEVEKSYIDSNLPENWTIAKTYSYPVAETISTTTPAPIVVTVEHATKTVTPGQPGVTPDNPAYKDLFKTVTRTINVQNPLTHDTDTTTETVTFGRTGTYDEVTNSFTKDGFGPYYVFENGKLTDDATGSWAEFDAPEFTGFTPSQAVVEAKTVNAETPNETVTITYTKSDNGNNTTPTKPTDNGNQNGNNNGNGGNQNNGQVNHNGNNGGNNTTINTNNGGTGVAVKNNDNGQKTNALPQTGNTKNSAAVAGLGLASIAAMLGLGGLKKKND